VLIGICMVCTLVSATCVRIWAEFICGVVNFLFNVLLFMCHCSLH
jgi:hypothetical protein